MCEIAEYQIEQSLVLNVLSPVLAISIAVTGPTSRQLVKVDGRTLRLLLGSILACWFKAAH